MAQIWTMGEMIVEIMREKENSPLFKPDVFKGPYASGAPAIFIDTVAKAGGSGGIIGSVGDDDFGKCITDKLSSDGADCSLVKINKAKPTGSAFVTYFSNGDRKFIFHISGTAATTAKAVTKMPDGAKYFHIMGCSLTADEDFGNEIIKTMEIFSFSGAKISFDPNIRPELIKNESCMQRIRHVMKHTDIFMPGKKELLTLTDSDTEDEAVKKCFEDYDIEMLVVKDGSNGSRIYSRSISYSFGIYSVEAKDATGAGDSFDGAFLTYLAAGRSIEESALAATAAAALNTAEFGPMEGKISPEEIKNMILKGGRI